VTLTPPPDLEVTAVSLPSDAQSDSTINVSWTVKDDGPGDAVGSWTDSLQLQRVGGGAGVSLGSFTYDAPLQAGKSYTRTERVSLPRDLQGQFRLQVTTNSGNSLFENGATGNNTRTGDDVLTVALAPQPDLQVQSVTAPKVANAGAAGAVQFTVINQGTVATSTPHWSDAVYLSLDDQLSGDDLLLGTLDNGSALGPRESYATQTGSLVIPPRFGGDVFLIVKADNGNAVFEGPNEDNNTAVAPLHVNPVPPADLVTSNVVVPDQSFNNSDIQVRYTVTNKGSGETNLDSWTDTVWLMEDRKRAQAPALGHLGGVVLGTFTHTGSLKVGDSYDNVVTVHLPSTDPNTGGPLTGQWYVTPWTNSYDQVLENTLSDNINPDDPNEIDNNNYKAAPITLLQQPPPDLVVTSVQPQASAVGGDPFTVSWAVKNQGAGATAENGWVDSVYLSDKPTLNAPGARQWYLGGVTHTGALDSDAGYTAQQTFDLSPEVSGRYVIVQTGRSPTKPRTPTTTPAAPPPPSPPRRPTCASPPSSPRRTATTPARPSTFSGPCRTSAPPSGAARATGPITPSSPRTPTTRRPPTASRRPTT
jgi:hypothetical protein